ncbi:hypothetical protein BHE74_00024215 [Ensete ventricosum]|nr:hypothetical protein BHE74_00024215 [Ensete ventricosum]
MRLHSKFLKRYRTKRCSSRSSNHDYPHESCLGIPSTQPWSDRCRGRHLFDEQPFESSTNAGGKKGTKFLATKLTTKWMDTCSALVSTIFPSFRFSKNSSLEYTQMDPSLAKRLWHMIRAACYMLRKGFCKHKLMMDLHLLLKRGKLAGKAIGNFVTFHHHHDRHTGSDAYPTCSCRSMDPAFSSYNSKEVEFSCTDTPSYPSFFLTAKRKNRHRHGCYGIDVAALAQQLETLSSEISDAESSAMTSASPSPAPMWSFGKSPAAVRQLRVTDSPFPMIDEGVEADGRVDREAEEFIKRFYEKLRLQQSVPATPEYQSRCRRKPA